MLPILEFLKGIFFCAGYLSGGKSFPKQLSPEEENKLLLRHMQGDEQARHKLIEHNLRLVAHIAKKFAKTNTDTDDYISIGTVGLIKGINTFRIEKGKLATYISKCVENEILMYLRSAKKNTAEISLSDSIGEDSDGNKISLLDILASEEEDIDFKVTTSMQIEKLNELLAKTLTPRERVVIELRYGLCGKDILPQRLIARQLNISRSYVSRIEKKALLKLKRQLEHMK